MKEILLFLGVMAFLFIAWVYTGGPQREISRQGPYITPVTRPGEQSQGYRVTPPSNPLNSNAYPRQVGGETIQTTEGYGRYSSRPTATTTNTSGSMDLHAE